jgi:hypothetical protein
MLALRTARHCHGPDILVNNAGIDRGRFSSGRASAWSSPRRAR